MNDFSDFAPVLLGSFDNLFGLSKKLFQKYGGTVYYLSDDVSLIRRLNLYLKTQVLPASLWKTALEDLAKQIANTHKTPILYVGGEPAKAFMAEHPELESLYIYVKE